MLLLIFKSLHNNDLTKNYHIQDEKYKEKNMNKII